jgi:hypothetical protein
MCGRGAKGLTSTGGGEIKGFDGMQISAGDTAVVGSDVHDIDGIPGLETFRYNAFITLTAGTHTAWVEWRTFPTPSTTSVEERSLIVIHR